MDIVNLIYQYINKFINSKELIGKMNSLDLSKYTNDEKQEINKLIIDINKIVTKYPNEIDDIEKIRLKQLDKLMEKFSNIKLNKNIDDDAKKKFEYQKQKLKKEKNKIRDGGERYKQLFNLLINNNLYVKYAKKNG